MSVSSGPEIVNDGLVFSYDMGNTQKSWKGAPTTNLVVTTPYTLTTYTACTGPVSTANVSDATGQPRTINRYTVTATGGTPRARIVATGLSANINYTFSCKLKYNGGGTPSWYIDSSKGNPEGGVNNNTFNSQITSFVAIGNGWYQFTERFNFASCSTGGSWSNFGFAAPDASYLNQTFDVYDIQFEQNAIVTPYVAGTRSNTQAILDQTNTKTVTVNSLTYNSDGTVSFGTSGTNYFSIPSIDFSAAQTIEIWLKPEENDANRRNPYNQAYGGYGTWTHEPSGVINYFYGDAGVDNTPYVGHGSSFTVLQDEIACVCTTRDTSTSWWYKNGVQYNSYAHAYGTLTADTNNILIGNGYAGAYYGRIFAVKLYNRALSAQEVLQNFNALRSRYSI